MLNIILFIVGLLGLWLGAEILIGAAVKLSRKMGLNETFIGLTILAFGTDFPEIMVALTGAKEAATGVETSGIIVGNIIGSNMAQISMVLGVAGMFKVLKVKRKEVLHNGVMLILSTIFLILVSLDGVLGKVEGLGFLVLYFAYFLTLRKGSKIRGIKKRFRKKYNHTILYLIQLAFGLYLLSESSHFVVSNGLVIADTLNVSQTLIGVLLIGIGTSLPELIVSISAILKGANGLSVGNVIGSNIVDILIALGLSSLIHEWHIERMMILVDMPYLLFTTVIVVLFLLTKETLERKESALLLGLYMIYVTLQFFIL